MLLSCCHCHCSPLSDHWSPGLFDITGRPSDWSEEHLSALSSVQWKLSSFSHLSSAHLCPRTLPADTTWSPSPAPPSSSSLSQLRPSPASPRQTRERWRRSFIKTPTRWRPSWEPESLRLVVRVRLYPQPLTPGIIKVWVQIFSVCLLISIVDCGVKYEINLGWYLQHWITQSDILNIL